MRLRCAEMAERLTDLLEGDLTEQEEVAALEHLASCTACESVLTATRDAVALAHDHGRVELTEDDRDALWSRLLDSVDSGSAE